jgi:hypothetical protein
MLLLAIAVPAAAKPPLAEARISGPGLSGGDLRISGRGATSGMWASGIDLFDHLGDEIAGSIAQLGLTAAGLGPRYVVSYRFDAGSSKPPGIVRQELYPYAKGGPVTYTPPGQRIFGGLTITAGWYQSSLDFFQYLVDQGLPESNPVVAADRESAPSPVRPGLALWVWIALALTGLSAVSVAALRLRRRALAAGTAHR